ncbi:MAG: hypothetical protein ACOWWM_04995 [Desulfobacterales bacterium]
MPQRDEVAVALNELKEELKKFAGNNIDDRHKDEMDTLVESFFRQEIYVRDIKEIRKELYSMEKLIQRFQNYLQGRHWPTS